jgi:ketosteroid isomerase-like protein
MSATTSGSAVDVVRRFYDLVEAGEFDEVRALLHDDVVISEPPQLPFGGTYLGPTGFDALIDRIVGIATFAVADGGHRQFQDGDPVLVHFDFELTSVATGERVRTPLVELFTVRAGKIAKLDIYYKDPGAVAHTLAP